VPVDEATIGLVDRIFTRIGARETWPAVNRRLWSKWWNAGILNNATPFITDSR